MILLLFLPITALAASNTIIKLTGSSANSQTELTLTSIKAGKITDIHFSIAFSTLASSKQMKLFSATFNSFDFSNPEFQIQSEPVVIVSTNQLLYTGGSLINRLTAQLHSVYNPSASGNYNLAVVFKFGTTLEQFVITVPIEEDTIVASAVSNGNTYVPGELQVTFEIDLSSLKPSYADLNVQIEFPLFKSRYASCTNFVGLSDLQYCQSMDQSIYIYNRDKLFIYAETIHSFTIQNFSYPANLEMNTATLYLYDQKTLLKKGSFTYFASLPTQFDRLYTNCTTYYATRLTTVTIFALSQYYILPSSDLIIESSKDIVVTKVTLNAVGKSFSQNLNTVTVTSFNDQEIDDFVLIIAIDIQNPSYVMDINFSVKIIKISECLYGNAIYTIQPNEYASFIASRDSSVVSEMTTLHISIQLSNPLTNGEIHIQFPSELNLSQQIHGQLTGSSFLFSYTIQNPSTMCETSRFESQAFENGNFKEKLYQDVLLAQTPNSLINNLQISLDPSITSSVASLSISMISSYTPVITFDDTFSQQNILCSNCTQINMKIIQLTSQSDVFSYINTPRSSKPQIVTVATFLTSCQQSSVDYEIKLTPIEVSMISKVTTGELNKPTLWQFILILPMDIYTSDTLTITFPMLDYIKLQCSMDQLITDDFDCSQPFNFPASLNKGYSVIFYINGLYNPSTYQSISWKFTIKDSEDYEVAIFQQQFSNWQQNVLQYAGIYLINNKLMPIKEALLQIGLQFQVDRIEYIGNQILYCDICTTNSDNSITIKTTGNDLIEIPFRFLTTENQRMYQFQYNLTTYYNNQLRETGYFSQTIVLGCKDGCGSCIQNFDNCTSCNMFFFLINDSCVDACPDQYYSLDQVCYPCLISNCTTCGFYGKEICIECGENLDLYNNSCIIYNYSNTNVNTSTTQNSPAITVSNSKPQFSVKYSFPGILLLIFIISLSTLVIKILNHTSIAKSFFFAQLGILEQGVGLFIFIYFLALGLNDLASFSTALIIFQIIFQLNCLFHIKPLLDKDTIYENNLKSSKIFKGVHYIILGYSYIYFIMFASKITTNQRWNLDLEKRKDILSQVCIALKTSLLYSVFSITIMVTAIYELRQLDSLFIEVIAVNIASAYLNFYHQISFDEQPKYAKQ